MLSLLPKVFCTTTLTWALFVHLFHSTLPPIPSTVSFGLAAILYTLCIYTYFQIIRVGPGSPLDYASLRIADIEAMSEEQKPSSLVLHNAMRKHGQYKVCVKCSVWKPDRTHHCSASDKCVLRMDHYCPWFSSCIGHRNQKLFVQFLLYSALYSTVCFIQAAVALWDFFSGGGYENETLSLNLVFLAVVSLSFGLALSLFAGFQVYLVLKNMTYIELSERNGWGFSYQFDYNGRRKLGHFYDLGMERNWKSVMGSTWVAWVLPVRVASSDERDTYGNGMNFEVDEGVYGEWVRNGEVQGRLNEQLKRYSPR